MAELTVAPEVMTALASVLDPHLQVPLVEMGMLNGIEQHSDGTVVVRLAMPCLGCPAWEDLQADVEQALRRVDGVDNVCVKVDWTRRWSKDDVTGRVRDLLSSVGVQLL
ncbi:DUF59 domain-containing protein [Mycobacterium sp. SM1]|uniref:metal-sulfur cluster assembly factor n=1 Tax=Mycobacterium sp. SM1 TaxID=2816243 RepID=UPI001BCD010D|nr:iron-sulfur cluster assembly protein [Mycobacterium sp. SM1]MBS4730335.1 DUF59 domain-containing protein [Mycobacterium sp. SM1]